MRTRDRIFSLIATAVIPSLPAAEHRFGFEGCGVEIDGPAGEVRRVEIPITLSSPELEGSGGAEGWSFTVTSSRAILKTILLEGIVVETLHDHDGDPLTPSVPEPLDLVNAATAEAAILEDGKARCEVVLDATGARVLAPGTTQTVARITVEIPIPPYIGCGPLDIAWTGVEVLIGGEPTFAGVDSASCPITLLPCQPSIHLSVVPRGESPSSEGEFLLKKDVYPGTHLVHADVVLRTAIALPDAWGAQGWSISLAHDPSCMEIHTMKQAGLIVPVLFNHDGDPSTPPLDSHPLDLGQAGLGRLARAQGGGTSPLPEEARGLTLATAIISLVGKMALRVDVDDVVLQVTYAVNVEEAETTRCRVAFQDGLRPQAGQPIKNLVTWEGYSYVPRTHGLLLELTGRAIPFRSGDANADSILDLSDAVTLFAHLFLGGPSPSCRSSGDVDDNGVLEITDPVFITSYLFTGGPPPRASGACAVDPTPDALGCEAYPHCP